MSRIKFNIAAKCDKAGRQENQDNYWVCPDLSKAQSSFDDIIGLDIDTILSDNGALLVVADGMGGMNAGDKASEIVVETIKECFSHIPQDILKDDKQIQTFIRESIIRADKNIKGYAKANTFAEGLGSTIVLTWLLGEKVYCAWCGDSRIYRYNPNNELVRLSHDHSYVQELVDEGKIPIEDAFEHPDSNIVTRGLGDNGEEANPEFRVYDICERDVLLLCSDGLCGLLRDKEIEDIISVNSSSTKDALSALWKAGEKAGWSDNATIGLLQVVEGGNLPKGIAVGYPESKVAPKKKATNTNNKEEKNKPNVFSKLFSPPYLYLVALLAVLILGSALYITFDTKDNKGKSSFEFTTGQPKDPTSHSSNCHDETPLEDSIKNNNEGNNNDNGKNKTPIPNRNSNTPNGNVGAQNSEGNSSNMNGHTDNERTTQTQPDARYIQLLNSTINDYKHIRYEVWPTVQREGNITDVEKSKIKNFINNVESLTKLNNPSYKCLDAKSKADLSTISDFAKELKRELPCIPLCNDGEDSY